MQMPTWMETEIEVLSGRTLAITATGQIDMYPEYTGTALTAILNSTETLQFASSQLMRLQD